MSICCLKKIVSIAGLFLLMSMPAYAQQVIRVGYIEFPPVFFTNDQGQPEGFLIDLTRNVIREAGYLSSFKTYPTKRMAQYLAEGKIDLWVGLPTLPEFQGTTYIGESKVAAIHLHSYSIGDKPPIHEKQDLVRKKIIILRGYSYGGWIKFIEDPSNNVDFQIVSSHSAGLQCLALGRKDYLLDYEGPVKNALKKTPVSGITSNKISSLNVFFVVSRKCPNAETVLKRLEDAYQRLNKNMKKQPSD